MSSTIELLLPFALGTSASVLAAYLAHLRSRALFYDALSELERHISASVKSVEQVSTDRPKYFIAARIRYCAFLDDVEEIKLGWFNSKKIRRMHKSLILAIRNSDIFVEEAACRVDQMNEDELSNCLKEVVVNLQILEGFVSGFLQELNLRA